MRRFIAAFLVAVLLAGCGTGSLPPSGLTNQIEQVAGVADVEFEAGTPSNTGQTVWSSTLTLDEDLSPAEQDAAIAEFYRLLDATGEQDSYTGGEFILGPDKQLSASEALRLDNTTGLLDFLAQLPNYSGQWSDDPSLTVAMELATPADLIAQTEWLETLQVPEGLSLKLAIESQDSELNGPDYQRLSVPLPLEEADRRVIDDVGRLIAGSKATGLHLAIPGVVYPIQLRYVIDAPDEALFNQLLEVASVDTREMEVSAHYPGQDHPHNRAVA